MKTLSTFAIIGLAIIAFVGLTFAGSYNRVNSVGFHGKTAIPKLTKEIDSNSALSETGIVQVASVTVTNGATLTLSAQWTNVTPTGEANNGTNTVTIATPYGAERLYGITIDSAATNLLRIDDDGTTLSLGSNMVLNATSSMMILTTATNKAVRTGLAIN